VKDIVQVQRLVVMVEVSVFRFGY